MNYAVVKHKIILIHEKTLASDFEKVCTESNYLVYEKSKLIIKIPKKKSKCQPLLLSRPAFNSQEFLSRRRVDKQRINIHIN